MMLLVNTSLREQYFGGGKCLALSKNMPGEVA